jgi:hypothetical protein
MRAVSTCRYPTVSANFTAFWVTLPGGLWYPPKPKIGICTLLFSLTVDSMLRLAIEVAMGVY